MRTKKPMSPWATYEAAMLAARVAAFALADAIERYLRKGVDSFPGVAFQNACDAANAYAQAVRVAAPYHFATIHPGIAPRSSILTPTSCSTLCGSFVAPRSP